RKPCPFRDCRVVGEIRMGGLCCGAMGFKDFLKVEGLGRLCPPEPFARHRPRNPAALAALERVGHGCCRDSAVEMFKGRKRGGYALRGYERPCGIVDQDGIRRMRRERFEACGHRKLACGPPRHRRKRLAAGKARTRLLIPSLVPGANCTQHPVYLAVLKNRAQRPPQNWLAACEAVLFRPSLGRTSTPPASCRYDERGV